ncbi:MAG: LL-diaminopimelate aminotransferase [Oscillospiraceae bacterium]|nr:LL-diaminopimelate aminotransferase [Oscillospiraceae bacterium]
MKLNPNYRNLQDSYLFVRIAKKVSDFAAKNRDAKIIRMGIGDVTLPLPAASVSALKQAAAEMGEKKTFRGYDDNQGYDFLKNSVSSYYRQKNVEIDNSEIFISDGAKSDAGNILDIFSPDNTVLIPDPVYPVYVDTNIMNGRKIVFTNGNESNGFLPMPDENISADIIYICSPNNPTGAVYTKEQLTQWVEYAISQNAVILFDAAYEAFVRDENLPSSIYQIKDAKKCAVEICSLSKTAGFTGTRCGYTIVPSELEIDGISLNRMWLRRQNTKFNGVSYIVQRGAEAVFSQDGQSQTKENISYYLENAKIIRKALTERGIWFVGGIHSPYVWLKCPGGIDSWEYFDYLLEKINIVGTPGSGFGKNGEGFFRLSAFGNRENVEEAMDRMQRESY